MAEDMRGKSYVDLSCDNSPPDYSGFSYLIYQSKKPSGLIGLWMMKLWNRVYMPMVVCRSVSWIIRSDLKLFLMLELEMELLEVFKNAFSWIAKFWGLIFIQPSNQLKNCSLSLAYLSR